MTIKVGDTLPSGSFMTFSSAGPVEISTDDLFKGKKVVLFAVPGAFTPTCSEAHMPSFVARADDILGKGVDTIACMAVNDVFVMKAWGDQQNADKLTLLADGSAAYTKALGIELDLVSRGLGVRADRFAMIVDDGKVIHFAREAPGAFEVSSAEAILNAL